MGYNFRGLLGRYQRRRGVGVLALVLTNIFLLSLFAASFQNGEYLLTQPVEYMYVNGSLKITHDNKNYYFPPNLVARLPWKEVTIDAQGGMGAAEKIYHEELANIQVECLHRRRLGAMNDGGWDICMAGPYMPKPNNCLIYSFGIDNKWSFDDAVVDVFGCEVHSFDPTISSHAFKRGDHIHFHPVGLHGYKTSLALQTDSGSIFPVDTLSGLMQANGHEGRVIDYLKFDIELSEWSALPEMYASGVLRNIKQISFEAHIASSVNTAAVYKALLAKLSLLQDAGFKRWHSHRNEFNMFHSNLSLNRHVYYSQCQEMYYLNMNYLTEPL